MILALLAGWGHSGVGAGLVSFSLVEQRRPGLALSRFFFFRATRLRHALAGLPCGICNYSTGQA